MAFKPTGHKAEKRRRLKMRRNMKNKLVLFNPSLCLYGHSDQIMHVTVYDLRNFLIEMFMLATKVCGVISGLTTNQRCFNGSYRTESYYYYQTDINYRLNYENNLTTCTVDEVSMRELYCNTLVASSPIFKLDLRLLFVALICRFVICLPVCQTGDRCPESCDVASVDNRDVK